MLRLTIFILFEKLLGGNASGKIHRVQFSKGGTIQGGLWPRENLPRGDFPVTNSLNGDLPLNIWE